MDKALFKKAYKKGVLYESDIWSVTYEQKPFFDIFYTLLQQVHTLFLEHLYATGDWRLSVGGAGEDSSLPAKLLHIKTLKHC